MCFLLTLKSYRVHTERVCVYTPYDKMDYLKSVTAACLWVFLYLVWLKTEKHALLGSKQLATEEYIISFP